MRIVEILSGLQVPITNEENDLLKQFESKESVSKKDLSEREQLIATSLVTKDILRRKRNDEGKVVYVKKIRD